MMTVREYLTEAGRRPFAEWLNALRDRSANQMVLARIARLQAGNRGDWKPVGEGVFELRINRGPGYRVYCGQDGDTLVLLLCAGDKRSQAKDIDRAKTYWIDYLERRQPPVQRG